jgi:hypothetical protein
MKLQDIRFVPLTSSKMGRYYINAKILELNCRLITTHLESLVPNYNIRQQQIREILKDVKDKHFLWSMDSNLLPNENDSSIRKYDAFLKANSPKNNEMTFDARRNPNVLNVSHVARLDRVLCNGFHVEYFCLIGTTNIKDIQVPPSDHFGVLNVLKHDQEGIY